MDLLDALVPLHVAGGAVALLTMLVPLSTQKGGALHRRGGRVYSWAMGLVAVTALLVGAVRLSAGERVPVTLFLTLLAIQAGGSVWAGLAALRDRGPLDVAVAGTVAACGVAGTIYGVAIRFPLLIGFGALTVFLGVRAVQSARATLDKRGRVVAHLGSMIGASIATATAFLVVNAARLPAPIQELFPGWLFWVLPTAIGVPLLLRWSRRWSAGHRTLFDIE